MKSLSTAALALGASIGLASAANASIVLNFAGLDGAAEETILNYYNGGLGGDGSGPGPNFGITFGPDAFPATAALRGPVTWIRSRVDPAPRSRSF
jgi:hypothetical protein